MVPLSPSSLFEDHHRRSPPAAAPRGKLTTRRSKLATTFPGSDASAPDAAARAVASPPRPCRIRANPTAMAAPIRGPARYTQPASCRRRGRGRRNGRGSSRCPHRRRPKPGEGNVAADPECADRADVLRRRRGSKDHADQPCCQHDLHHERLPLLVSRTWQRRAEVLNVAKHGKQEQARERRSEQLDDDLAR
jgi:hypothetical protein